MPLLGDGGHAEMVKFLAEIPSSFARPDAILIISAHWKEFVPTVTTGRTPPLLYDYYGFPPESYAIEYPAAGEPALAREILSLLKQDGIQARADDERGFDHGVFVPLKLMYPDAGIPCVQLSLMRSLDPQAHIRMGDALSSLRERNVLILGSGFSFHNLRLFFSAGHDDADRKNEAFQSWLIESCAGDRVSGAEMEQRLIAWEEAPAARYCHPREEHLLPLHVCAGLGDGPGRVVFDGRVLGKRAVGLLWN